MFNINASIQYLNSLTVIPDNLFKSIYKKENVELQLMDFAILLNGQSLSGKARPCVQAFMPRPHGR